MKKHIHTIPVLLLVFMWVYAAVSKLAIVHHFEIQLRQMPWIKSESDLLVWLVPAIELIIAGILLHPQFRKLGGLMSAILLFLFTAYIILVLQYADSVPCSCGGIISKLSWTQHILFNAVFMLISLSLLIKDLPFGRRKQGYAENLKTE